MAVGETFNQPPLELSMSVKIWEVKSISCGLQLIFISRHCLISNNNRNKNMPKVCMMVRAGPLDLGHGKKGFEDGRMDK